MPRILPTAALILATAATVFPASATQPDFTRDVRPILSGICFKCHGPDDQSRKAGLRLDLREDALKSGESGETSIVPGKPEKSEFIRRITSSDPDEIMPPPKAKLELSEAQKKTLHDWVAAGAEYKPHWAFIAPRSIPPQPSTLSNPIDSFILARLEKETLTPSPEADRHTLLRRVSLDLIGLPPTPEEVDAFSKDTAPHAYERLVDRLLASPHYGERWARRWLDLARYADTNGYEKDRTRSIWPYRDWVVRALNADMPFDDFTTKQLAGDLLPEPTTDDLIATGFHRNTMLNEEGGIDPLEFRYHAITDRVATTGTTWLGLTIGCAQCHTHKFDPIQHSEYFQFMAFLNNADDRDLDLPAPDQPAKQTSNLAQSTKLLAELPEKWPSVPPEKATLDQSFTAWLARERERAVVWQTVIPAEMKSTSPLLTVQQDGSIFASGDATKYDRYELRLRDLPRGTTALRLEVLPDVRLPGHGPGMGYYEGPKGDFFLSDFKLIAGEKTLQFAKATASYVNEKFTAANATDADLQTGWSCGGKLGEAHEAVFVLDKPLAGIEATLKMEFSRHYACALGRFRLSATTDPRGAEAQKIPTSITPMLLLPDAQLTPPQRQQLREQFLLTAPELAAEAKHVRDLRKPPATQTTLVLQERAQSHPRPTFIRHRGEFLQPKAQVQPGVPAFLPALPATAPKSRLGLARWLVSPENPLTARVTVNRQWQAFFGAGLVATMSDFGFQGEAPSHPELLDWLAVDFIQQGWSLKKLHRLIATSATYRQSSRITPALLAKDPKNRLLARGPRTRVEAEAIRDLALRASGLLSAKMFGPPVRPPQPAGVTEAAYGSPKWDVSSGEDRYRRALYTFQKRSAPFALFNTFDAPSGEVCVARREVSNTPLQSLTLLNDEAFLECAQALGARAAEQPGSDEAKAAFVFLRCLARPPRAAETTKLLAFLRTQRERLARGELPAKDLAGPGTADIAERAAWTLLARSVLNLDETITKN